MTAQLPEELLHWGTTLALGEDPLRNYLIRLRKSERPNFVWSSTACWRGYVGTWEFRDEYLCLVGLRGAVRIGEQVVEANLDTALPWARGCLRATWLTGMLRCPEGRLVQYAHRQFASVYERDRWFEVRNGRLAGEFVVVNPPPPLYYRIDHQGKRQCVRDFRDAETIHDPLEGRPFTDAHLVWGREPEDDSDQGYVVAGCFNRGVIT